MSLKEYAEKRDPEKTTEPFTSKKQGDHPIYVIQEHHARNLHWDLRLEKNGILRSWAIPKEPPKTPGIKRLAVEVEDHPLDYATFEGDIPQGQYGGGNVRIWDSGTYSIAEETEDKLIIDIKGTALNGEYALIRTKMGKNKKNWLFFKRKGASGPHAR